MNIYKLHQLAKKYPEKSKLINRNKFPNNV